MNRHVNAIAGCLSLRPATLLLGRLVREGKLVKQGSRRWTYYVQPDAMDAL